MQNETEEGGMREREEREGGWREREIERERQREDISKCLKK